MRHLYLYLSEIAEEYGIPYDLSTFAGICALILLMLALVFAYRLRKASAPISLISARRSWHERSVQNAAAELAADPLQGLTVNEARQRLQRDGRNELRKVKPVSAAAILLRQFGSVVIWVLIGAAAVSEYLGEKVDGIAIIAIVILNALIGFVQEFRAERAAAALARLAAPKARILRGGYAMEIAAAEVVAGDVLLLEAGDLVAADALLIDVAALRANEAPLTGESQPVDKMVGTLPSETPLAERSNMVFLGTAIVSGSARALVVASGMNTELGRIAQLLETAERGATPLQQRLDKVGQNLLWACLSIVALVFVLGLLRSIAPFELFLSAVSLAVAAIPEGLPAVVTVSLALGVQRMIRRNALVRRLPSVETLGCARVICADKTGTLTVGEMTARRLMAGLRLYTVSCEGYGIEGGFFCENVQRVPAQDPDLYTLLYAAAACNDAEIAMHDASLEKGIAASFIGDPTEAALLVAAAKGGISRAEIEASAPRLAVLPFDSERKRMTVVRRQEDTLSAFVKGAPEVVLERCSFIRDGGEIRVMTDADRISITHSATAMAHDALRVLAAAQRQLTDHGAHADEIERDLVFLGLFGLQDPPRAEAKSAVARCKKAGIRTVMITGDHPNTAAAIARELGILADSDRVASGVELAHMKDEELQGAVQDIAVYARVTAEDKLRIVRAWKAQGSVVAMTGDGVNDAPALKEAAIGIAMGRSGTEVTKEAADLIITDDNFASIVAAVEEGRGIYDNISKTLSYLLACNAAELTVMLVAALIGWPVPLLPLHLLWINLVTDSLPALALAVDPIDSAVLERPPRPPQAQLLDREFIRLTVLTGFLTAATALAAFAYEFYRGSSVEQARDAIFTALVIVELLLVFGVRSSKSVFQIGLFSNPWLFSIVVLSFLLQLGIHHIAVLQELLSIAPLTMHQYIVWIGIGFIPLTVLEIRKMYLRRKEEKGYK